MAKPSYVFGRRALARGSAAAAVLLVPLALDPARADAFAGPKATVILVIGLCSIVALAYGSRPLTQKPLALVPASACIAAVIIEIASTLVADSVSRATLGVPGYRHGLLVHLALGALFFGTLLGTVRRSDAEFVLRYGLLGFAIVATYAGTQAMGLDPISWQAQTSPFGSIGNPNDLAMYSLLGLSYLSLCREPGWMHGLSRIAVGAVVGATVGMTDSRSGLLGLVAWLASIVVLESLRGSWTRFAFAVVPSALGVVVGVGVAQFTYEGGHETASPALDSRAERSLALRRDIWRLSIFAVREDWLLGLGPTGVQSLDTEEGSALAGYADDSGKVLTSPHSLPLEVALSLGVPAFGLALLGATCVAKAIVTLSRSLDAAPVRGFGIDVGAALLGWAAAQCLNPVSLSSALIATVACGLLLGLRRQILCERPVAREPFRT